MQTECKHNTVYSPYKTQGRLLKLECQLYNLTFLYDEFKQRFQVLVCKNRRKQNKTWCTNNSAFQVGFHVHLPHKIEVPRMPRVQGTRGGAGVNRGAREACHIAVHSQQTTARMVMGVQDKALSATQKNAYLSSQTTLAKTNARSSSRKTSVVQCRMHLEN